MLSTLLIAVPFAAALLVWVLPLRSEWTANLAGLSALAAVGLWVGPCLRLSWIPLDRFAGSRGFDFSATNPQYGTTHTWFEDLGISYSVGMYGFQFWLVGLTVVVGAAAIGQPQ